MYNPHTNWNHGTETHETLLQRPLSQWILSYVVKGKQFVFSKIYRLVLGCCIQWVPETFPELQWLGCKAIYSLSLNGEVKNKWGYTSRPPCAYMADTGTAVPLHCEGDKGYGIHLGMMYRGLGFGAGIVGMVLHWDQCFIFHCRNACAISGLSCNVLCVIRAGLWVGRAGPLPRALTSRGCQNGGHQPDTH
jgi:hypothetical protein